MSQYTEPEEIMSSLSCTSYMPEESPAGVYLYHRNGMSFVNTAEGHNIIIGNPGTGKTSCVTLPLTKVCLDHGNSVVVLDCKGDHKRYFADYARSKGYKVVVIDYTNIAESQKYNPLYDSYQHYKKGEYDDACESLNSIAYSIYPDAAKDQDPFWNESARTLFRNTALLLYALSDNINEINFSSIYSIVASGEQKFGADTYFQKLVEIAKDKIDSQTYMELYSYTTTVNDTRSGVRIVMLNGLSPFCCSPVTRTMVSGSDDIDIANIEVDQKYCIFCVIPDSTPIYNCLAAALISQFSKHYLNCADRTYNGILPRKLHLILEEFHTVGNAIEAMPSLIASSRSRNITITTVLQSISQLKSMFANGEAETIHDCSDVIICFRTNSIETMKEMSALCGEHTYTVNGHSQTKRLLSPEGISKLPCKTALVYFRGQLQYVTELLFFSEIYPDFVIPDGGSIQVSHTWPEISIYNFMAYVRDEMNKKINTMMANMKISKSDDESDDDESDVESDLEEDIDEDPDDDEDSDVEYENLLKMFVYYKESNLNKTANLIREISDLKLSYIVNKLKAHKPCFDVPNTVDTNDIVKRFMDLGGYAIFTKEQD